MSATAGMRSRGELILATIAALERRAFAFAERAAAAMLIGNPADIEATFLHGLALAGCRRHRDAASVLNRVAAARPDHAHPCRDLAGLLDPPDRGAQIRACLDLMPEDVRLRLAWAEHLHETGDLQRTAAVLRALLISEPDCAAAHHRLGLVLAELDQFEAALSHLSRTVALDPVPAMGWANLGMLLKIEGRFDAAFAAYGEALRRAPNDARIRVNHSIARLHAGQFAAAWRDHDWRFELADTNGLPRDRLLRPELLRALAGRTVLVTHEAGFGDSLQFCRYVPLLAALGARVLLAIPSELERLMSGLEGVAGLVLPNDPVPGHDWHCPMMSLPRVFQTGLDTIPAGIPYLSVDPVLIAKWAARLPWGSGIRAGLVWAGQARPWLPGFATVDQRRSMRLAQFEPLAEQKEIRFVSLQAGPESEQALRPPAGLALHDPMTEARDFADTAAIIANLDLVIGVDTSVIHLAGALGKPVFLLDRYDNCWRWLSGRTDSPWYPTLRIFRQERPGQWGPVVRDAAAALARFAARRPAIIASSRGA